MAEYEILAPKLTVYLVTEWNFKDSGQRINVYGFAT
jgi:hypothetical protein